MKILWIAVCYSILVSLRCTNGNERVKRQQGLTFSTETSTINKETFLLIDGSRIISLSGSDAESLSIAGPGQVTCNFVSGVFTLRNLGVDRTLTTPIQTCYEVNNAGMLNTFTTQSTTFGQTGRVYLNNNALLYIDNSFQSVINFIEQQRLNAPTIVEPVSVLVVRRVDALVLNLDNTNALNDQIADSTDDTLILTGSRCRNLGSGSSVIYRSQGVNVFNGPLLSMTISNIEECYVLVDINGCLSLTRHPMTRSGVLPGPGLLCDGTSQLGGAQICLFSGNAVTNMLIQRRLVEGQMSFTSGTTTGMIVGILPPNSGTNVFTVTGDTQTMTFSNAAKLQYNNGGIVRVQDRSGNVIQQIGTAGSPATLGYYSNTRLQYFDMSSTTPLDETVNGLELITTGGANPMVFVYPGDNSIVRNEVQMLINAIPTPAPVTLSYSVRSTTFGTTTLSVNNQELQMISTGMSANVGRTQCIIYDMNVVNVYENCDTSRQVGRFENIAVLRVAGPQLNMMSTFMGSASSPILGPGRFFFSGMNGFFTGRQEILDLIDNANIGAMASVNIVRRMDTTSNTAVASLVNGNTVLFTFNVLNTSTVAVDDNEAILYSSNTVGIGRVISVPDAATLQFVGNSAIIRGGPGPDMNVTVGSIRFVQEFPGSTMYSQVSSSPSEVIPGGGILYIGNDGVVYNRDQRVTTTLYNQVDGIGGITESFPLTNLNSFNGRTIQMFNQSAGMVLIGPGLIYINDGGRAFYTTDSRLITRIPSAVSQIVPLSVTYSRQTGTIDITTTEGTSISSISVNSDRTTIPSGSMVTVGSGIITIIGSSGTSRVVGMNIETITVFNGISAMSMTAMGSTTIMLPVPGTLYIDEMEREAIYITEPSFSNRVSTTINNAFSTFAKPIIPESSPKEITSTMATVDANFGQVVTAIEGSTVRLRCSAGNANPPAMFGFFQRDINSQNFTSLIGAANARIIMNAPTNDVTLEISNVASGNNEYRCDASNLLGQSSAFTRITGLSGRAPEIQNNFFTGSFTPGTAVVTARTGTPTTLMPIIDTSQVSDRTQITTRVLIGCRAKGRSVPAITWRTMPERILNFSLPSVNISFPGPGQSILSVNLVANDVQCVTYICMANNSQGSEEGSARICPQRYVRAATNTGPCSDTCGIGVRQITFQYTRITESGSETVEFANLPTGLVKPDVQFCAAGVVCPVSTFAFVTTDYTSCTVPCETGVQTRNITCFEDNGVIPVLVDNDLCINNGLLLPQSRRNCNTFPCPEFTTGEFGTCSRTCRGGIMTRVVGCEMVDLIDDVTFSLENLTDVSLDICLNISKSEMPPEQVQCNSNIRCPVAYSVSFGAPCDEFNCQEVNFECINIDEPERWVSEDIVCRDQGLMPGAPIRSCGGGVCNFGMWRSIPVDMQRNCSVDCGVGERSFNVICTNRTNTVQVIDDRYCNGNQRPRSIESCFLGNCPGECEREPSDCPTIRLFNGCKRTDLFAVIEQCCISCPLQASI